MLYNINLKKSCHRKLVLTNFLDSSFFENVTKKRLLLKDSPNKGKTLLCLMNCVEVFFQLLKTN